MTTSLRKEPGPGEGERELFDRYYPRIRSFFYSRGCRADEAEDLSQEALSRVFQNMGKLRSIESLDAWVLKVCANLWKNELRRRHTKMRDAPVVSLERHLEVAPEPADRTLSGENRGDNALARLLQDEKRSAVRSCFDELPARMRRCLEMHIQQNQGNDEIAALLHVAPGTVKSQLHQAKQRLRDCARRKLQGGLAP